MRRSLAQGEKPLERDKLDDLHLIGTDDDPWTLQDLLPLENLETGEVVIFVTGTVGGRRAVSELAERYATQRIAKRKASEPCGQPIVRLGVEHMNTRDYGKVPRPDFKIVGWDETASGEGPEASPEKVASARDDMDDEIPF